MGGFSIVERGSNANTHSMGNEQPSNYLNASKEMKHGAGRVLRSSNGKEIVQIFPTTTVFNLGLVTMANVLYSPCRLVKKFFETIHPSIRPSVPRRGYFAPRILKPWRRQIHPVFQ